MSNQIHRWQSLAFDEFEEYVAELWEHRGYVTERTRGSHDYGVDVFAHPNNRERLTVIQAKRNKPGNKVGGPVVQKTVGAREQYDAHSAVVVTTSSFTNSAETVADAAGVKLIDGDELTRLHERHVTGGETESETRTSQGRFDFPERWERIAFWLSVLYFGCVALYIFYRFSQILL